MDDSICLLSLLLGWIAIAIFIVFIQWRRSFVGVGLCLAYLLNLWLSYWIGSVMYLFPDASQIGCDFTISGAKINLYAIIAFGIGSLLIAPFIIKLFFKKRFPDFTVNTFIMPVGYSNLPRIYILLGLSSYFILNPLIGSLPTLNALVSVGMQFLVVGLCLACFKALREMKKWLLSFYLMLTLTLPLFTLVVQGFTSYGACMIIVVISFFSTMVRSKWKLVICALIFGYIGLSFYVTYRRDRVEIRRVVWGGESTTNRVMVILESLQNWEWFDITNKEHLFKFNERFNQNFLLGAADWFISSGYKDYAYGETILQALIAPIPRAFWPNKPIVAGSGDIVSDYTGIVFDEETSVGVGHTLELYINFGVSGVVVGFLIIGILMTFLDFIAGSFFLKGDWLNFMFWFFPSFGFLQVAGSFVEATATACAGFVLAFLVNKGFLQLILKRE